GMTNEVDVESAPRRQVTKQLFKKNNVVRISERDPKNAVERELMLATVKAEAGTRGQVIELVGVFEGRIVDVGHDQVTVMLAGTPAKLDDFEELIRSYEIVGLQRAGPVALPMLEAQAPRLRSVGTEAD